MQSHGEKIIKSVNSLVLDIVNTAGNTQTKEHIEHWSFQVEVWDPYGSLKQCGMAFWFSLNSDWVYAELNIKESTSGCALLSGWLFYFSLLDPGTVICIPCGAHSWFDQFIISWYSVDWDTVLKPLVRKKGWICNLLWKLAFANVT